MAEIPVEKRSSKNWLWILLVVLLVGLLAWWLLSDNDRDEVDRVDQDQVTQAAAPPGAGPLVAGENVYLEGVEITQLSGDSAFIIDRQGETVPVYYGGQQMDGSTEGQSAVAPGQRVNITGRVRATSNDLPDAVDPAVFDEWTNYVQATAIEPAG